MGWQIDPLFAQAKARGIKALSGHAESTDVTNDVNGGPSGVGVATAAGKAAFWDMAGTADGPKVVALEGEFAMTEGHAQELKTQAVALQVGKRLRIILSDNNAGIDDKLLGGVVGGQFSGYRLADQWTSYGWNVMEMDGGGDYSKIVSSLGAMEQNDPADRRPMILIAKTTKGYWPAAIEGVLPGGVKQIISYQSHPYGQKMNAPYFVALAESFENHFQVSFDGIRNGPVTDERERLIQFKKNVDVVMSVLEKNGLGDWLADRLVALGDGVSNDRKIPFASDTDPFLDERLQGRKPSARTMDSYCHSRVSGMRRRRSTIALFQPPGKAGAPGARFPKSSNG